MAHPHARRSLEAFLADAFGTGELRRFLRLLPGGDQLLLSLPDAGLAPAALVHEALDLLNRHGLIGPELFAQLAAARPKRADEVRDIAASFGVPRPVRGSLESVASQQAAAPSAAERPSLVLVRAEDGLSAAEQLKTNLERQLPEHDIHILRVAEWSAEFMRPPTVACAVLFTRSLMQSPRRDGLLREILEQHRVGAIRAVPVLVTETRWRGTPFGRLRSLPGNSVAVEEWSDKDAAWAEVIRGLVSAAASGASRSAPVASPSAGPTAAEEVAAPSRVLRVEHVFRTTGVPEVSFVPPAQLKDLEIRVGFMGQGLVVEGPSGIGKTTATRHAIAGHLGVEERTVQEHAQLRWLSSKDDADLAALQGLFAAGYKQLRGIVVIDDFHHLARPLQRRVADFIKLVADSGSTAAKIIVIGINPVGSSLVQDFPDVAGRFAVIPMSKQPDAKIEELIRKGEQALNITFDRRADFVRVARGSFFTAQLMCQEAALREGILETVGERRTIINGPDGVVLDRVLCQLKFKYHEPLLAFASYDRQPPPRGATLVLLWMLAKEGDSTASLATARSRYPVLDDALAWLLQSNLSTLFARQPRLAQLLFYNRDAGILSAEDPQLEFYLNNLNWPAFARDSGHPPAAWDPDRGFVTTAGAAATCEPEVSFVTPRVSAPTPVRARILHLSDLHLDSQQHAVLWYGQLLADLRTEQGIDRIDAVVVSGDVTNRATAQEFDAAAQFLRDLQEDFGLNPHQFVIVPGNHDLNWTTAKKSYRVLRREDATDLVPGRFIDSGEYVEVPDDLCHRARFQPFADFYYSVRLEPYPLDYEYQATIHHFADARMLILGLNSAWSLDHHFKSRADIHAVALGRALRRIQQEPSYADCVKIAVWHHPVHSPDDDRIRDSGFVERLAQAGFRFALHGHIHKPQQGLFRYDMSASGRRIDFIGAGTFGAPTREWQPGYPLQYQILELTDSTLRIESRRREELNGAWRPDARFTQGPGLSPRTSYEIVL